MKKLMVIVSAVLFSTAVFAQNEKKTETPPPAQTQPGMQTAPAKDKALAHECYMMKEGALMHCMGTKAEPQATDVKLKNGTLISAKGEVKTADGKTEMLANGQCIAMDGKIGDCVKMHEGMKMPEAKPADAK